MDVRRQDIERANDEALRAAIEESLRSSQNTPGAVRTAAIPGTTGNQENDEALMQALRISAAESRPTPPATSSGRYTNPATTPTATTSSRQVPRSQPAAESTPSSTVPQHNSPSQQASPPWVSQLSCLFFSLCDVSYSQHALFLDDWIRWRHHARHGQDRSPNQH